MKVLNASQLRAWDEYTLQHEPIASIDLMERAAATCFEWLKERNWIPGNYTVVCGKGNNGGDGLAIARMLAEAGSKVKIYILEFGTKGTDDFQTNLERIHRYAGMDIQFLQAEGSIPTFSADTTIIDALYGSGLSRPLEGLSSRLVEQMNRSGARIISVDMPSGLSVDQSSKGNTIVKADHTLSFQCYKPALLLAENACFIGEVHILNIGLHKGFWAGFADAYEMIDAELVKHIYIPRSDFAHKGNFGHALLVAGSYGKIGAAALAAKACMRSGTGLVSVHTPRSGYEIIQGTVPEVMVTTDFNSSVITDVSLQDTSYSCIGVGPGIGTASETRSMIKSLLTTYKKPMVIDADGLNCVALSKDLLKSVPAGSILTPHPKEFDRLFGPSENDYDRISKALQKATDLNLIIVLKGHHTFIAGPDGKGHFNCTGNSGMATGGSGDVLTGILTGLVAQGYEPMNAALLGVWLHGLAGDLAAATLSKESMIAGDIVEHLGAAFRQITTPDY